MGELIVTWHDYVRLGLFATNILLLMLTVKLAVGNGRWRHPFRDARLFLAIALVLALTSNIKARAAAIGSGPWPSNLQAALSVIITVFIVIWMIEQVEFKVVVRHQEKARARQEAKREARVEARRARERAEVANRPRHRR